MKRQTSLVGLLLASLFFIACSSDDNAAPVAQQETWPVLKAVQDGMSNFDNLMADPNSASYIGNRISPRAVAATPAFNDAWTDLSFQLTDPTSDDFNDKVSAMDYMGYMLDAQATRENGSSFNLFGRFDGALSVGCAIMNLVPLAADGYPANTTTPGTITFSADNSSTMTNVCGMEDAPTAGTSVEYEVADAGGQFDKKITLRLSWNTAIDEQILYIKYSSTEVNILSTEKYDSDGIGTHINGVSVTMAHVNLTTGTIRAQYYATGDDEQLEFHRGYYDGATEGGYMLSYTGNSSTAEDNGSGIRYVLVGNPDNEAINVALSFGFDQGAEDYDPYNACVNPGTGAIAADGANLATCNAFTARTITDATVFSAVRATTNAMDTSTANLAQTALLNVYTSFDENTTMTFDETNFHTQAL